MNAVNHFRAAMRAAGLDYVGPIYSDGKLHRFRAGDDKGRNSWYVVHAGPPAAGAFGCWKRGFKETWCDRDRTLSQIEWGEVRRCWHEADGERKQAERERQWKARKIANWILTRSTPVTTHAYLAAKGVNVLGNVREYRGALVLPLCDVSGHLHSLQFIGVDGSKNFLSGGRVTGCFFTLDDKPDGPVIICEGYATGVSIHAATGHVVVCAMNCGNLLATARAMLQKWPQREIIVAADNDAWTDNNPGFAKARDAALAIGAKMAVPHFKNTATKLTDFNDLQTLEGLDTVKTQIENAQMPKESDQQMFERLAKLTPAEYDRVRDAEAQQAGIRAGTLDSEVAKLRLKNDQSIPAQGSKVMFNEIEPWSEPVNGAELLDEITATLKRFVVAHAFAIIAASLIVLHTYAFDLGEISPILFITGPTKRCGKSKLLAILMRLVSRPFAVSSATAAGIYRIIELYHPTLGIDEVDSFMQGDEQLRGLINSGHTRDAAFHLGCAATGNKEFEPRRWSTWTPKIFAGIGRLADTLEDRAVIIEMVRRRKDESCERLRHGMQFNEIVRKAARFVNDNAEAIKGGNPPVPEGLNDRAADNWTPLLTLADLAGGDWPVKARQAALALSSEDEEQATGTSVQLLADLREIFGVSGLMKLASQDLVERLWQIEGRPWAEYGRTRRPISPNQVANLLRGFHVSPHAVRIGDRIAKGYEVQDFADAFSRYLPEMTASKRNNVTTIGNIDESNDFQNVTQGACNVSKNAAFTNKDAGCNGVTVQNAEEQVLLI